MDRHELKKELIDTNPGLKDFLDDHAEKRDLAIKLRTASKKSGHKINDIALRAKLTVSDVEMMESPSGEIPEKDVIERYRAACQAEGETFAEEK